jgi:exodeoxyribonuclease VIII
MADVMVDLETLGRRPGCAVLSIGAVEFCPQRGLGKQFYVVVNRQSQRSQGLHEDPDTLKWWMSQSEAARQVLEDAESPMAVSLEKALAQFTTFLAPIGLRRVKMWGNGSDFDNAILACLYGAIGQSIPWDFWNNRCYRTLKNLRKIPAQKREGTYHNALDDAKTQALHAVELLR